MSPSERVRRWLGTDQIASLTDRFNAQEATMTTMLELLTGLVTKTTEASAAQQASFLNLHNAVDKLTANVARLEQLVANGDATEEMQTLATEIRTNLDDMKKAADTADDGFEPVETPTEPTEPGTPTEPATPVEPTPDVPGDPQVPGDTPAEGETPADNTGRRSR